MNLMSAEHHSRSRIRNRKISSPLRVHNYEDRLPSLETEQQFRASVAKRAKGGDSLERNLSREHSSETTMKPFNSKFPPRVSESKSVVSSSVICSAVKRNEVKHRRTAAEIDAFFTRLSTQKHMKVPVDCKRADNHHWRQSAVQWSRGEATKGLRVNVVRTRTGSASHSDYHPLNIEEQSSR